MNLERHVDRAVEVWDLVLDKKKLFGGLAYLIDGKMCFAIRKDRVLLRVGTVQASKLLERPGVHRACMGSRIMKGWLAFDAETLGVEVELLEILAIGRNYAWALPSK